MIRFLLLQNRAGKTRLAKYYVPVADGEKRKLEYDVHRLIVTRDPKHTNFAEVCGACSAHVGARSGVEVGGSQGRSRHGCAAGRDRLCRRQRWQACDLGARVHACLPGGTPPPHPRNAHTRARAPRTHHQFKTYKIVYRRYAGLFFSVGIDVTDNELTALEAIHLFVEILDHYFSNVCELDLVFNFHKVAVWWKRGGGEVMVWRGLVGAAAMQNVGRHVSAECLQSKRQWWWSGPAPHDERTPPAPWWHQPPHAALLLLQVYLILDEFILGGEFEETSKKVHGVRPWASVPVRCRQPGQPTATGACDAVARSGTTASHREQTTPTGCPRPARVLCARTHAGHTGAAQGAGQHRDVNSGGVCCTSVTGARWGLDSTTRARSTPRARRPGVCAALEYRGRPH
jgi:hypothetical protein